MKSYTLLTFSSPALCCLGAPLWLWQSRSHKPRPVLRRAPIANPRRRFAKPSSAVSRSPFTLKNVKILVHVGQVKLRGPIRSDAEKQTVGDMAASIVGAANVTHE